LRSTSRSSRPARILLVLGPGQAGAAGTELANLAVAAGYELRTAFLTDDTASWIGPEAVRRLCGAPVLTPTQTPPWATHHDRFDLAVGLGLPRWALQSLAWRDERDPVLRVMVRRCPDLTLLVGREDAPEAPWADRLAEVAMEVRVLPEAFGQLRSAMERLFGDLTRRSAWKARLAGVRAVLLRSVPEILGAGGCPRPPWVDQLQRQFRSFGFRFGAGETGGSRSSSPADRTGPRSDSPPMGPPAAQVATPAMDSTRGPVVMPTACGPSPRVAAAPDDPAPHATPEGGEGPLPSDLLIETWEGPYPHAEPAAPAGRRRAGSTKRTETPALPSSGTHVFSTLPTDAPPMGPARLRVRFFTPDTDPDTLAPLIGPDLWAVVRQSGGGLLVIDPQGVRLLPHLLERPAGIRLAELLAERLVPPERQD